jgi:metal-responsive CopG/Arc/MetJ family transcriptional regulator
MKTAVSIRDNIFQNAEKYAKKTKVSRSQLYSDALEEYLAKRSEADLIARINAVCEEVDTSLDPAIRNYQSRIIKREKW